MKTARATLFCLLLAFGCEDEVPYTHDAAYVHDVPDAAVDLGTLEDAIDALDEADEELGAGLSGLRRDLESAGSAIDALAERLDEEEQRLDDHDERIDALEPCEGDACMSTDFTGQLVELFRPIIEASCESMSECCSSAQMAHFYGPSFTSAEDCVALQIGYVEREGVPDLPFVYGLWGDWTLLAELTSGGIALVDDEGLVEACVEYIRDDLDCNTYEPIDECDDEAWAERREDPCHFSRFIEGTRELGERCGGYDGQCKDGLSCKDDQGFCVRRGVEGDVCANDLDCGSGDYERHYDSGLHCNLTMGRCEPFRQLGEPCVIRPYSGDGRDNELVECAERLACHPERQVCVGSCSEGATCVDITRCEGDTCFSEAWCGPDLICAIDYWGNSSRPRCREPFALGAPCVLSEECESGLCEYVAEDERECVPARTPDGSACTLETTGTGESDSSCASGFCASDGVCAPACAEDATCEGARICLETEVGARCEAPIANGDPCVAPLGAALDAGCASGFCDEATCAPKAELGGACASGRNEQCPDAQYCDEGTCTARIALGEACSDSSDTRCAPGLECTLVGDASACHGAGAYPDGASCESDASCGSAWCDEGLCRALLGEDDACEKSWDGVSGCEEGLDCLEGVCAPALLTCTLPSF